MAKHANWQRTLEPDHIQRQRFIQLCELCTDDNRIIEYYFDTADKSMYCYVLEDAGNHWLWCDLAGQAAVMSGEIQLGEMDNDPIATAGTNQSISEREHEDVDWAEHKERVLNGEPTQPDIRWSQSGSAT